MTRGEIFDDSVGFDDLERDFVRRFVPDFDWLDFPVPSPRHTLKVPLRGARVALVGSAGAHLPDQEPIPPDGDVRLIPNDAVDLRLAHVGYDTERASKDPDVVFPLRALHRLVAEGTIGSVAPTAVSTMGFVPDGHRVLEHTVPATVEVLRREEVDLALLVPA